ncbi:hypothetical protein [Nocardiopsis gilva]|uniref:hypothetical protein n=1 Tax=Nocardiopsis gilva TaxID=280236 RepID=UPI0004778809|nr:hypothetical protein [Nocardiopsis gilva]
MSRPIAVLIAAGVAALSLSVAVPASAQQFISAAECLAGGGVVLPDLAGSPTGYECSGGEFDGFWVHFFG